MGDVPGVNLSLNIVINRPMKGDPNPVQWAACAANAAFSGVT